MTKGDNGRRYFEIGTVVAKEIERKFLLSTDTWRELATHKVETRDGLLAFRDGRKIWVRFCDDKATLSVKGPKTERASEVASNHDKSPKRATF